MYTLKQFLQDFPDDDACLEEIFSRKYGAHVCACGRSRFYKLKGRPVYACGCGKQINVLADTIFRGTKYPLTSWFYVMYLMSKSKNGVSAAFVQRQLGCKYQTAWRICMKIRELMADDSPLNGEVEIDEAFVRAKPWRTTRRLAYGGRARMVIGMVERGGKARAVHIDGLEDVWKQVHKHVPQTSIIYSDAHYIHKEFNFTHKHESVNHSKGEWVRDNVHTQNIESFWKGVKLTLQGTHQGVTYDYLQAYLNERAWVWSQRFSQEPFLALLERL